MIITPVTHSPVMHFSSSLVEMNDDFLLDEASVLAFLDGWVNLPVLDEVNVVEPQPEKMQTATRQEPLKSKKKPWLRRQREEILSLRELVKQLEGELKTLKIAAGVQFTTPKASTERMLKWETIAHKQRLLRQNSEAENIKLRKMLTNELLQTKAERRAFLRKIREGVDKRNKVMALIKQSRPAPRPLLKTQLGFQDLLSGIDELYADLDGCFERVKMNEVPCPGRRNDSLRNRANGIYVELRDCYALPFNLCEVEQAIWTLQTSHEGDTNIICAQYFDADNNTKLKVLTVRSMTDGIELHVGVRVVVRKFIEQNRTVYIARMHVEPIQEFFSLTFRSTARLVLTRGESTETGPTTVLQTHCQVTDHEDSSSTSWRATPHYYEGSEIWANSITSFNNKVEDILLLKTSMLPR